MPKRPQTTENYRERAERAGWRRNFAGDYQRLQRPQDLPPQPSDIGIDIYKGFVFAASAQGALRYDAKCGFSDFAFSPKGETLDLAISSGRALKI